MSTRPVTDDIGDWAQVPEWVIDRCTDLTPICLNAYTLLALYRNWQTGEAWPSLGVLAERLGCSESVARRALHTLRDEGLIRIDARRDDNGRQTTNHYWIARIDPLHVREGGVALTPGSESTTESGKLGEGGSRERQGGGSRQRDPNETSNEQVTTAAATSGARELTAAQQAKVDREAQARALTQRYWDWYRRRFSADPPEAFMAIKAIVEWALKDFEEGLIVRALAALDEGRPPRPVTRQTVQEALLNLRPLASPPVDGAEAQRLAEEQEIARRELADEQARLEALDG